jgi:hypothetical protein
MRSVEARRWVSDSQPPSSTRRPRRASRDTMTVPTASRSSTAAAPSIHRTRSARASESAACAGSGARSAVDDELRVVRGAPIASGDVAT